MHWIAPTEEDIRMETPASRLCMVALPGQIFYSTHIPVCRWFLAKNNAAESGHDARLLGGGTEPSLVA